LWSLGWLTYSPRVFTTLSTRLRFFSCWGWYTNIRKILLGQWLLGLW